MTSTLQVGSPDRNGGRGFSFGRLGWRAGLINQSQLAVPLSCGLTTPIGHDFARAVAEREARQCKT